jgi:hypothetical protein
LRPPLTERLLHVAPTPVLIVDRWLITWTVARDISEGITRQLPTAAWLADELTLATRA